MLCFSPGVRKILTGCPRPFFAISTHVCLKRANKIAFLLRDVCKSSFLFCGRTNHSQARAYISFLGLVKSGGTRPAALMQIRVIYRRWHHRRVRCWGFMKQWVGWLLDLGSNLWFHLFLKPCLHPVWALDNHQCKWEKPFFSLSDPPSSGSASVPWANVPARLHVLKSPLENPQTGQPACSEKQLSGSRSRRGPSAQLTGGSSACWVTPPPFSHSIAPIPALIFRSLRSCEKLHANREKKKIMVVQNSFLYKHKTEWNFLPLPREEVLIAGIC